ncbi:TonB-dependent receptor [Magnetospirillum fulvum MGU-K5]|uniref:TonB-dependent receptor n=2 Tax=Magnetospirillum fulvum TaxID=1082 RepID=S9S8R3_MAGFU|nr:TonB-dependent receptor [Magnetospirillum fulvum MGU-K5]
MKLVTKAKRSRSMPGMVGLIVAQMMSGAVALAEEKDAAASTSSGDEAHQLKAVTVTAEKMSSTEQDTPVSMTVVTGEDLERSGGKDTIDVVRQVPNMYMTKAGQHSSVAFLSMRGVTPFMEAEQPVGFFVDGVHYRNVDMELLDIDRVEVLRGPQSTLYGRNTEAGAVNIITRDPEPYREGQVSVGYGNYNRKTVSAISGGSLGNQDWSYRAAIQALDTNGYFTRDPGDTNRADDANDVNARFKVRWRPKESWDVVATYDGQRYREGSTNIALLSQLRDDPHTVSSNFIGSNNSDTHGGNLRASYEARLFNITSISAFTSERKKTSYDVDATAADLLRLRTEVDYSRFTQEVRLSSLEGATGPRWVGGLYYFDQTDRNHFDMDMDLSAYGIPGLTRGVQSVDTTTDTRNMAAFGQVSWPLVDTLSLITGLRYDIERKQVESRQTMAAFGTDFSSDSTMTFHAWLPKLGLEYKPLDNLLSYVTYSEGYKAGGFNNLADRGQELYRPEYTKNYEIGVKHTGFGNRLQSKLSLFWIDWTDQQVEETVLSQSNITNAGRSVSRGVELELAWQASKALLLKAGGGWNDAHFVRYVDNGHDYAGNRPPNAPAYTYSLGADYRFEEGVYAHIDWLGTGDIYYDSANTQKEKPYGLLNMKTGYQFDSYEIAFWIKNALNATYATRAFNVGSVAAPVYAGIAGDPQTFGVTMTARW